MGLLTEVWVNDIEDKLFEGQEFINMSVNHDPFIVNSIVHVPQSGANPNIEKNRSVFPATITERTDTELTYTVDDYSTDPIRVRDFEETQLSYVKRQSVIGQHIGLINERCGTEVAHTWSAQVAANIIRTSGANTGAVPPGATGLRLKTVTEDIRKMAVKLDYDNVPNDGRRILLMQLDMYYELFDNTELIRKDFMDRTALPAGVIDRLFGFNIMVRPTVVGYEAGDALKAVGSAFATTDSFGCIAWHPDYVAKAKGSVEVYLNEGVAEHYGDIMSARISLGSSQLRTDEVGVVALAQQDTV